MANNSTRRRRVTGRSEGSHLGIPHYVVRSHEFGQLTGWQLKLLIELAGKYTGFNNGNLSCAYSQLRDRGWRSTGTLWTALKELLKAGWIITTRHGGSHRCALYAITWKPVDECEGKWLEVAPQKAPCNAWQQNKTSARNVKRSARHVDSNAPELVKK